MRCSRSAARSCTRGCAGSRGRADSAAYLRELARAYLEFGLENPRHYALISAPRRESAELLPSAEAARRLVFQALVDASRARDPEATFQALWAVLHGVVSLRVSRPDHPWCEGAVDLALDAIERGILQREAAR